MSKGEYTLKIPGTGASEGLIHFDFRAYGGSYRDFADTVIKVERIFRLYPGGEDGEYDQIHIETRIEEFLQLHLKEVSRVFIILS